MTSATGDQQSSAHQQHVASGLSGLGPEQLKQYEDRKKVVAAIYLNTMSNKV